MQSQHTDIKSIAEHFSNVIVLPCTEDAKPDGITDSGRFNFYYTVILTEGI